LDDLVAFGASATVDTDRPGASSRENELLGLA
jgi:hypothetical protein